MSKMKLISLFSLIVVYLGSAFTSAEEINVAVASNFNAPMKMLVKEFESLSKHQVKLSFGSSGKIFAQIRHGAPFHVFFSADQTKPIALENAKLVKPGSRFTYATGALALWSSREGFLEEPQARLQTGDFNRLALANPKLAPYGTAAVQVLESFQAREITQKKWIQGENIAQTFQFVASGNADLGFVAVSQILQNQGAGGSHWIIPTAFYEPIRQDAVILKNAETNQAAIAFVEFIKQAKAQQIIESFGYRAH